jgi:hypothetical protein
MKTVKLALTAACLLFILGLVSCSTRSSNIAAFANQPEKINHASLAVDLNDDAYLTDSDDDHFDYEQYASEDSGDDDTYMGDPEEDLEPAPDFGNPPPPTDDGSDEAPVPDEPTDEEQ